MDKSADTKGQRFQDKPLEERKRRCAELVEKNPNKVPVIFDRNRDSSIPDIGSIKFVSTRNLRLAYFSNQIRSALKLTSENALFFSSSKLKLIKNDALLGDLYDQSRDEDGFLYIEYREVDSFGQARQD